MEPTTASASPLAVAIAETAANTPVIEFMGKKWLLSQLAQDMFNLLQNLAASTIILLFFILSYKMLVNLTRRTMDKVDWDPAIEQLIVSVVKFVVWGFAAVTIAAQMGVDVTSLIAGVGVASFAVSFAFKDILQNLMSGIVLLTDKPFYVGDIINVEGAEGEVIQITLRSTRLKTSENHIEIIPNANVLNKRITNKSGITQPRQITKEDY
ncbi:MAG: mechanosensitive ion channel family protein [Vulcanimicrobiota bacterium]